MNEMQRLIAYMNAVGVPFELMDHWSGTVQLVYPSAKEMVCDVVSFPGTYGGSAGYLEIMGLTETSDDVEGWLSAENVFQRIHEDYMRRVNKTRYTVVVNPADYNEDLAMEYIIKNLPGISIEEQAGNLIQIIADEKPALAIEIFHDNGLLEAYKDMVIEQVMNLYEEDSRCVFDEEDI